MLDPDPSAVAATFTVNEIRNQMGLGALPGDQGDRLIGYPWVDGVVNHVDESFQPKPDRGDRALAHRLLFEHGLDPAWVDELGAEQVECAAGSGHLVQVVSSHESRIEDEHQLQSHQILMKPSSQVANWVRIR